MSKIYDIAFRMGVLFNVLLFTLLNVGSYIIAHNNFVKGEIERESAQINVSWANYGFSWGFPFGWEEKINVIEGAGGILNIIIAVFCGFAFGFLFKFIWSQISSRRIELK
jgi:uncharacterized membrane protein YbjE (DUF340 family)